MMSFENKSGAAGPDVLETQRQQLWAMLDADLATATWAISLAPGNQAEKTEVPLSDAFSAESARVIGEIFAERDGALRHTLLQWILTNLQCMIVEKDGSLVLTWDDPNVFKRNPPMSDGTGE